MFRALLIAAVICTSSLAQANGPPRGQPVSDPLGAARQLSGTLEAEGAKAFTEGLASALGNPEARALGEKFAVIEKKKADVSSIVFDKTYGDAIRVIVQYQNGLSAEHPFVYFKFVYKRTGSGWVLTNFDFDDEAFQAFPQKFAIED